MRTRRLAVALVAALIALPLGGTPVGARPADGTSGAVQAAAPGHKVEIVQKSTPRLDQAQEGDDRSVELGATAPGELGCHANA